VHDSATLYNKREGRRGCNYGTFPSSSEGATVAAPSSASLATESACGSKVDDSAGSEVLSVLSTGSGGEGSTLSSTAEPVAAT
jgi:hypothetical protein